MNMNATQETKPTFDPLEIFHEETIKPLPFPGPIPMKRPTEWFSDVPDPGNQIEMRPVALINNPVLELGVSKDTEGFLVLWQAKYQSPQEDEGELSSFKVATMGGRLLNVGSFTFRGAWHDIFYRMPCVIVWSCPTFVLASEFALDDKAEKTRLAKEFAGHRFHLPTCKVCGASPENDPQNFGGFEPTWLDSSYLLEGLADGFEVIGVDDDDAPCVCLNCHNDREALEGIAKPEAIMDVLGGSHRFIEALEALLAMPAPERATKVIFDYSGDQWLHVTLGDHGFGDEFLVWGSHNYDYEGILELILNKAFPEGHPSAMSYEEMCEAAGETLESMEEILMRRPEPEGFSMVNGGQYWLPFEIHVCRHRWTLVSDL